MASTRSLEERIEDLEGQLGTLRLRLERIEGGAVSRAPASSAAARTAAAAPAAPSGEDDEQGLAHWAGTSALLPYVSTVSFLLVAALALRTLTDSGIIGAQAGAFVGVAYAASLMLAGWVLSARRNVLAPVFAVCGAALLCSIVVETNTRFASLSTPVAYAVLGATALFMTLLGERFGTALPGVIGTLGATVAGLALMVPHPAFLPFGALLLGTSALGVPVTRRLKGDWVGWTLFGVSALTLLIWGIRIKVCLTSACYVEPVSGTPQFPYLANAFALLWVGQALYGLMRPPRSLPSALSLSLPTLGCTAAFVASLQVAAANGSIRSLGVTGLLVAAGLVALAAWSGMRGGGAAALNAFVVAAVSLFAFGFASATGSFLGALPLLSCTAFGLALLSARLQSGGTRVISYLLQVGVAGSLVLLLTGSGRTAQQPGLAALAAAALAAAALAHHRWCRRHSPPAGSIAFAFLGSGDRCAVALLTASLAGSFFLLRTGALIVVGADTPEAGNVFSGIQSVIITVSAMALLALAFSRRSTELRSVGVLVTLVGAAKVVIYDLVALQGVPRVVSIFSFGLLAAVASVVFGRWQRRGSG